MRTITQTAADFIADEDRYNILQLMVDNKMLLNDDKSHMLTMLKRQTKLGARTKLGEALVEARMPIKMTFEEFFEMMKDRSEWMAQLQEINWQKAVAEKTRAGEQLLLFG